MSESNQEKIHPKAIEKPAWISRSQAEPGNASLEALPLGKKAGDR